MKHKIFESVYFNGRNQYRAIDRIRRRIALELNNEFSFYSFDNITKSFDKNEVFNPKIYSKKNKYFLKLKYLSDLMYSLPKNYDLIHYHIEQPCYFHSKFNNILKRTQKNKKLLTFHGVPNETFNWDNRSIYRYQPGTYRIKNLADKFVKQVDYLSAVSRTSVNEVENLYGINCFYQPDGVDHKIFIPVKDKKSDKKRLKVLFTGSFQYRKQPHLVIKIAKKFPDHDFLLFGRGILLPHLIAKSSSLKNVKIITHNLTESELVKLYQDADIYLFPSISEGLANTLLEAAAVGLPLLAANATSNHEVVENGKNGFLFNNLIELEEQLDYLLNYSDIKEFGNKSRQIVERSYTWEIVSELHKKVFSTILE
jgi:glycosyltransferase involved in cell wall biosynthesis